MGLTFSVFTFRLYHRSVRSSGGVSWGPRSESGAFGSFAGLRNGRVDEERQRKRNDDIEAEAEAGKVEDGRGGIEMRGMGNGNGSRGVLGAGSSTSTAVGGREG